MTDSLWPVLMIIGMACTVAVSMLALTHLANKLLRGGKVDTSPYECGMDPFERARRHRFSVHFYLVAMLFILFDIEAAFMYPWAVTFKSFAENKLFVLGEMGVFLGILVVGFVYLWGRGALEWE
jgi:NADH-quinone oxidoreductase subunit A